MPNRLSCVALSCVVLLPGCADAPPHNGAMVVDSSGVQISTSPDVDDVYAQVDTQPALSLGGADDGPAQFYNIHGLHLDREGNIWVANRGSNELRIFRPDGSHWKTVGRKGDGPGEFRLMRLLGRVRGERVALWDDGNPRLTLITDQGEFDSVTPLNRGGRVPRPFAVMGDQALLVRFERITPAASLAPGAVLTDTASLFRYEYATGAVTQLATVSFPSWIWTGRLQIPVPFTIRPAMSVDGTGALHVADGSEFRIRIVSNGVVTESYGVDRPARLVTEADRSLYRAFYQAHFADEQLLHAYLSGLDNPVVPARLPAYSQLLFDDGGNTWARIYSPDQLAGGVWDVYGPDRQLLGQARTPAGLIVSAIAGERVAGVWLDELDVEHVRLHRWVRLE